MSAEVWTIDELAEKIVEFCEIICEVKFYPYQTEMSTALVMSLLKNDMSDITALVSRQMGKSEVVADTVAGMLVILPVLAKLDIHPCLKRFERGLWVGIFAPAQQQSVITYDRTRLRLDSEIAKEILHDVDFGIGTSTNNGEEIRLTNGSFVHAVSASENAHIEGRSLHLIILEEAQEIGDFKINRSIKPMGSAYRATTLWVGSAWITYGMFLKQIEINRHLLAYNDIKMHYEYDWHVGAEYNSSYKDYVEKERDRIGEFSDEFQMSYCCKWILERGMFITLEKFDPRSAISIVNPEMEVVQEDLIHVHAVGLDLGKSDDSTVLTIGYVDETKMDSSGFPQIVVQNWLELAGDDYDSQFWQIVDFLKHYNPKVMYIDAGGVGDPIADRFTNHYLGDIIVFPHKPTTQSNSDGYKLLSQEFNGKRIVIPAGPTTRNQQTFKKFVNQFVELEKVYKSSYMECHHPDRRDAHDDYCYSMMLFNLAAHDTGLQEIELQSNFFYQNKHNLAPQARANW